MCMYKEDLFFFCKVYLSQSTMAFLSEFVKGGRSSSKGTMPMLLHVRNEAHPYDGGLLQEVF